MTDVDDTPEVIPLDKLARVYRKMRAKIDELTKEYDAQVEVLKAQQDEIKMAMKDQMRALGLTSVRTPEGTIIMSEKTRYTTNDWDSFKTFVIEHDADLAIVTGKDAEGIDIIRHSTAHLMAYAVKELFPEAQVTIGPVIDNGFYYDFSYKRPFTPDDLIAIEKKMAELAKKDEPVTRKVLPRDEAVAYFKSINEHYKAELIEAIPAGEDVSLYTEGNFTDLCRGPHVPSTGKLKVFKLMKLAGAYWRGDSKNEMLQRVYGTAWAKKEELEVWEYAPKLDKEGLRDNYLSGNIFEIGSLVEHLDTGIAGLTITVEAIFQQKNN